MEWSGFTVEVMFDCGSEPCGHHREQHSVRGNSTCKSTEAGVCPGYCAVQDEQGRKGGWKEASPALGVLVMKGQEGHREALGLTPGGGGSVLSSDMTRLSFNRTTLAAGWSLD